MATKQAARNQCTLPELGEVCLFQYILYKIKSGKFVMRLVWTMWVEFKFQLFAIVFLEQKRQKFSARKLNLCLAQTLVHAKI